MTPRRPTAMEHLLAKTLRVQVERLPGRLRELKATRSYMALAEYLTAKGAPVGKSWLHTYLQAHPPEGQ